MEVCLPICGPYSVLSITLRNTEAKLDRTQSKYQFLHRSALEAIQDRYFNRDLQTAKVYEILEIL